MGNMCRSNQGCPSQTSCICGLCIKQVPTTSEEKRSEFKEERPVEEKEAIPEPPPEKRSLPEPSPPPPRLSVGIFVEGLRGVVLDHLTLRIIRKDQIQEEVTLRERQEKLWWGMLRTDNLENEDTIQAEAWDVWGKKRGQGELKDIGRLRQNEGILFLWVRPPEEKGSTLNRAPRLSGLWSSHPQIYVGKEMTFQVWAFDDPQEQTEVSWQLPFGKSEDLGYGAFRWEVPSISTTKEVDLFLFVRDDRQGSTGGRLRLPVFSEQVPSSTYRASFRRSPTLHYAFAERYRIKPGLETGFQLGFDDVEGDGLRYEWSTTGSDCAGRFVDPTQAKTQWKAPSKKPETEKCSFSLTIKDKENLQNSFSLRVDFVEETWTLLLYNREAWRQGLMTTTPQGHFVIVGGCIGRIDHGPFRLLSSSTGMAHVIMGLDKDGNARWLQGVEGLEQKIRGVKVLSSGETILWGDFRQTLQIGSLQAKTKGEKDLFLAKLDARGKVLWLRSFGGSFNEEAGALEIGKDDTIYVSGSFSGNVSFGGIDKVAKGLTDGFVGALSPQGTWLWIQTTHAFMVYMRDLQWDPQGRLWTVGLYAGKLSLDKKQLDHSGPYYLGFLAQIEATGWKEAETIGTEGISELILQFTASGDAIVCGGFYNTIRLGTLTAGKPANDPYFFLASRNTNGRWNWLRVLTPEGAPQQASLGICTSMVVFDQGIFLLGSSQGNKTISMGSFSCEEYGCSAMFWGHFDFQGAWKDASCKTGSTGPPPQSAEIHVDKTFIYTVFSMNPPPFWCPGPNPPDPVGQFLQKRYHNLSLEPSP